MTMIISQMTLTLAVLFLSSNHPLSLGFILMATSILFSILIFLSSSTAWMSYIVMMVFLSGSMIIFIYMTSISSNETIHFDLKYIYLALILNTLYFLSTNKMFNFFFNYKNLSNLKNNLTSNSLEMIYKTYSTSLNFMTTFIIIYLLLMMIVAVKIAILVKSPVRLQ